MKPGSLFPRLFFHITTEGQGNIPQHGPCLLIARHQSFLDPAILKRGTPRRLVFPPNPGEAAGFLGNGAAVCVFPEGEMSWYGGSGTGSRWDDITAPAEVPVIAVSIRGSYDIYPPFARRPDRGRVVVRYVACGASEAKQVFKDMLEEDRRADIALRLERIPRDARNIEEILYICPSCGELLSLHGEKSGLVECRACGSSWTLLRGKGLADRSTGAILPLHYIQDLALASIEKYRIKPLQFPVRIREKRRRKSGADGLLMISDDHFILACKGRSAFAFVFSYNDVESVYIEGRDRLCILCRSGEERSSFEMKPPLHACLFLMHFFRTRASRDRTEEREDRGTI